MWSLRRGAGVTFDLTVTCTKTGSKNDLFLKCRRKMKELSKKELSNVTPASLRSKYKSVIGDLAICMNLITLTD
jgi:hypothetical protein